MVAITAGVWSCLAVGEAIWRDRSCFGMGIYGGPEMRVAWGAVCLRAVRMVCRGLGGVTQTVWHSMCIKLLGPTSRCEGLSARSLVY